VRGVLCGGNLKENPTPGEEHPLEKNKKYDKNRRRCLLKKKRAFWESRPPRKKEAGGKTKSFP